MKLREQQAMGKTAPVRALHNFLSEMVLLLQTRKLRVTSRAIFSRFAQSVLNSVESHGATSAP